MENEIEQKLWRLTSRIPFPSDYFIKAEYNKAIDPKIIFPNARSYFLELGSGWGEVAVELASKSPETGFILMEKKINRVENTIQLLEKRKLTNIKFLAINFNWFFDSLFFENSFNEILLNFPDPWPKAKHRKHRSFDEDFLNSIFKFISFGGKFRFATDHGPYGREVIRLLRKNTVMLPGFEFKLTREDFPISYFEKKKIQEKKRIYFIEFKK